MKIKHIKRLLTSEIQKVASNVSEYCFNTESDFVRNRKLSAAFSQQRCKLKPDIFS